jgi:hypothetical protein
VLLVCVFLGDASQWKYVREATVDLFDVSDHFPLDRNRGCILAQLFIIENIATFYAAHCIFQSVFI